MGTEARLHVICPYCSADYLVIVSKPPTLRVMRSWCQFCGSRVIPLREDNLKSIDSFIMPEKNNEVGGI